MNIVFYVIVALVLALIYFILSCLFKGVGGLAVRMWNEFKENILGEEDDEKR